MAEITYTSSHPVTPAGRFHLGQWVLHAYGTLDTADQTSEDWWVLLGDHVNLALQAAVQNFTDLYPDAPLQFVIES